MTTMRAIPVDRYLVPADAPVVVPGNAVRLRQALVHGLPATFQLDTELSLALFVPVGDARLWREAEGGTVVTAASEERVPRGPDEREEPVARPPARLVLLRGTTNLAAAPLRAGLTWRLPNDGTAGTVIELWIVDYALHAGTLRELGDFGSFVDLSWRRIDRGTDSFALPAVDPRVRERFLGKLESQVGDES